MDPSSGWSQNVYDEAEEFARSVKLSLLGVTPTGLATFRPTSSESLASEWRLWCNEVFVLAIGPRFQAAFQHGHQLQLREIVQYDLALGEQLTHFSRDLCQASLPFIEGKEEMRGHKEWRKYVLKVESGEAPGHLPILFALHSVLFKLPLTCALQTYAWLEWKMGLHAIELFNEAGSAESPPDLFLEVRQSVAQIISPSTGGQSSYLRVV